jgi:hypothetical protein
MIALFEDTGDYDSKPNVHTANAVCNVRLCDALGFFLIVKLESII